MYLHPLKVSQSALKQFSRNRKKKKQLKDKTFFLNQPFLLSYNNDTKTSKYTCRLWRKIYTIYFFHTRIHRGQHYKWTTVSQKLVHIKNVNTWYLGQGQILAQGQTISTSNRDTTMKVIGLWYLQWFNRGTHRVMSKFSSVLLTH